MYGLSTGTPVLGSHIYRVSVVAQGKGLCEDYSVTLPASSSKDDFLQIVDDGILVRNNNFVQSTEMVI